MKKMFSLLLALQFISAPLIVSAAPVDSPEEVLFMDIPAVTVASKKAEDPIDAPGTVLVITDQDIERYGWKDLWQILRAAFPNFEMYNHNTKVDGSMRGFQ